MRSKAKQWLIIIASIIVGLAILLGGGYLYLVNKITGAIKGCEIQTQNFTQTLGFDYVNKWIVINVKVDGSDREYPFIFDTGAQTVVSNKLLNEIGSQNYTLYSSTNIGDTTTAFNSRLIVLKGLKIGDVSFKNIGCIEMYNEKWDMLNCISAYGIIGYNVIQTCGFQIDYKNKTLTLTDKLSGLPNYSSIDWVNYRVIGQETPIITGTINDSIKVDLFFDTGMSGGIVIDSPELYQRLSKISSDRLAKSIAIPNLFIRGEKEESFNSITYKSPKFNFLSPNHNTDISIKVNDLPSKKYSGVIGNDYLENYNITLDYKNKRVGFILNDELIQSNLSTFGFSYNVRRNKLVVSSVYVGSEAQIQGLCPGDEILEINDIVVNELQPDIFCKIYRNEYKLFNSPDNAILVKVKGKSGNLKMKLNRYEPFK
jgi:predicted aspartyl protease